MPANRTVLALPVLVLTLLVVAAGLGSQEPGGRFGKSLSFSVLEDYDKGASLSEVAKDFDMMRTLGVTTWRGSWGWDDYEPRPDQYDFAWLHEFAELAATEGIQLRPYIGYTAPWAAAPETSDQDYWNNPPAALSDWTDFVWTLAAAMSRHPNVLSYEIYNEQNTTPWWNGSARQYRDVLVAGSAAIRRADADATIVLGGLVFPDADWLEQMCESQQAVESFAVIALHSYAETWLPGRVENFLGRDADDFRETARSDCGGKPIWINEAGFATYPGRSEQDQAEWWVRAIASFAADPQIEHIGIYEIKDLGESSAAIGDAANYHLGITSAERRPKLAFHTIRTLVSLLGQGAILIEDTHGRIHGARQDGHLFAHLFRRSDDSRIAILWSNAGEETISLEAPGSSALEYTLSGVARRYPNFSGGVLRELELREGRVRIFRIDP